MKWDKIIYFLLAVLFGIGLFFPIRKYICEFFISFLIVFLIMGFYIKWAHKKEITNVDCHKYNKPKFADMGGYILLLGFFIGLFSIFPFVSGFDLYSIMAGAFTVLLVGFVGSFDDLFKFNEFQKILLLLVASIPLVAILAGNHTVTIPFYGPLSLGWVYSFVIIPILILVYSNATNMLAGYNGLEVGLGIITILFMIFASLIMGNYLVMVILVPMLGALIGFYYYNAYPAKVILGDVGNLAIGASIATAMIIGNMEIIGVLLTLIYLVNFGLYAIHIFIVRGKGKTISTCDKNGHLIPTYYEKNGKTFIGWHAIYYLMEHVYKGKLTEKGLVRNFFILHFIISLVVFLIYFL